MPVNARQYREHLYQNRSHPENTAQEKHQREREGLWWVQLSLIPFLGLEYMAEQRVESLPSGLVFPVGYLIFWAFFYTYYKPGYLEQKLTGPKKWDNIGIPSVLFGTVIWFVKVFVVELTETILTRSLFTQQKPKRPEPSAGPRRTQSSQQQSQQHSQRAQQQQAPRPQDPNALPSDLSAALGILGIPQCRDWNEIHRRYRELAKRTHPDLNPDITQVGRRFMMIDAAYRRLSNARGKYFQ